MKNMSVARRYARALYQLAEQSKSTDDVRRAFINIAHAISEMPSFERFLNNPLVKPEDKQDLVGKITSNKLILKFIYLLAKRKRLDLLPLIDGEVRSLCDAAQGIKRMIVRTPAVLSESQKKLIETDLAQRFGGKVMGQFEVAKELLGGIWIKMGDKVLDTTLRGKMDDLRHTLIHSTN
jgi:F-type H+-transporting ATPase subunit delta